MGLYVFQYSKNFFRTIFYFYIIILLILSIYPLGNKIPINDKFNHLTAFFIYIILFKIAYSNRNSLFLLISGVGLGVLIEVLQSFTPYRQTEFLDVVADTMGLVIGYLVIILFQRLKSF